MTPYEKVNVPLFDENAKNGYICTMCGQVTTLSTAISYHGYNLICDGCKWKAMFIFDCETDVLERVQKVGREHEKREREAAVYEQDPIH